MPITITNTAVEAARKAAVPGVRRYQIVDARTPGLVLRVGPKGAVWNFRFQVMGKEHRLALGAVDTWTIAEARALVDRGQEMLRGRLGMPDEAWLDRMKKKDNKDVSVTLKSNPTPTRDLFRWTFVDGRKQFLADIKRTRSERTHYEYSYKLHMPELEEFQKVPLPQISRQNLARVVADIHRSGRETTAEGLTRVLSSMWSWLARDENVGRSGVQEGIMRGLRAPEKTRRPSKRRIDDPTLEDLGRIIAICRSGAVPTTVARAIELLVWTLQRRRAVSSAMIADFKAIEGGKEGLWYVFQDDRKRASTDAHVIPLPAPAWDVVQAAAKAAKKRGSEYLFPQTRPRAKGMPVTHLHGSTLAHTMQWMPGVRSTPHHVRSVFGTFGEAVLGFSRPTTKLILDHAAGGVRSDVTGKHYSLHNGTHETWPVMRAWVSAVEADALAAAASLEPVVDLQAAMAEARKAQKQKVSEGF